MMDFLVSLQGNEKIDKIMYFIGFFFLILIALTKHKKFGIKKSEAFIMSVFTFICGVGGAMIMDTIFVAIKSFAEKGKADFYVGGVSIFGAVIFCPLFMCIILKVAKRDWKRNLDLFAPGIYGILMFAKLGCFLFGCCYGVVCSHGIFNVKQDAIVFPVQIFEVLCTFVVVCLALFYALRAKNYIAGTVYPFSSILYCISRFIWEFYRYYNSDVLRHLVFGLTFWQFCCVIVIIGSIIWIALAVRNKKNGNHDTERLPKAE